MAGTVAFFAASLVASVGLAIPDEIITERFGLDVPIRGGDFDPGAWLLSKLVFALGLGTIYSALDPAIRDYGARAGVCFGFATWLLVAGTYSGLVTIGVISSGTFAWWSIHYFLVACVAGAAMGAAVRRCRARPIAAGRNTSP